MIFTALAILVIAILLTPLILRDLRRAQIWARLNRKTRIVQKHYAAFSVAAADASAAMRDFGEALKKSEMEDAVRLAAIRLREAQDALRGFKEAKDTALSLGATYEELYQAQRKKS
jgi:hypothetical protein